MARAITRVRGIGKLLLEIRRKRVAANEYYTRLNDGFARATGYILERRKLSKRLSGRVAARRPASRTRADLPKGEEYF